MPGKNQNPESGVKDTTSPQIITAAVIRSLKDAGLGHEDWGRIIDPKIPEDELPDIPIALAARQHLVKHKVI